MERPRFRNLILATELLGAIALCSAARASDPPEVRGVIATRLHFEGDARDRIATAVLNLLASCTASHEASEKDWDQAPDGKCYLHFTFEKPRVVTMGQSNKVAVAEMVITFPLSRGRIWIRSGDKFTWFAMYAPRLCKPIQDLLGEAMPVEP